MDIKWIEAYYDYIRLNEEKKRLLDLYERMLRVFSKRQSGRVVSLYDILQQGKRENALLREYLRLCKTKPMMRDYGRLDFNAAKNPQVCYSALDKVLSMAEEKEWKPVTLSLTTGDISTTRESTRELSERKHQAWKLMRFHNAVSHNKFHNKFR